MLFLIYPCGNKLIQANPLPPPITALFFAKAVSS